MDNKEKVKTICLYLKNPHWYGYYEKAPSENCKRFIELGFIISRIMLDDGETEEVNEMCKQRERLKESLTLKDLEHLFAYAGNNPFRGECYKRIKELAGDAKIKVQEGKRHEAGPNL